jgi:transposase
MAAAASNPCAGCQQLQQQLEKLQAQVDALQEQLAKARKNSSTSSKPPSSDIVKPQSKSPGDAQDKRSQGAQPGHAKHERTAFPPEMVTSTIPHVLELCPHCGHGMQSVDLPPRVVQQVDVREIPLIVDEHRCLPFWCESCQKVHYGRLPDSVERAGLVGPGLTTLIAYLKGVCHASYSTIRKYLRDVVCVSISRGQLAKVIGKVSAALQGPFQELLEALPNEPRLNVDETGHKDRKVRMWTWCFRAELYTLFKIDARRSADVLMEVLGKEFDGVIGCDCFSAYRRYMRECGVTLQFCLAHLIRDVKFLTTLPGKQDKAYGEGLREALRSLFFVIHDREKMTKVAFRKALLAARDEVLRRGIDCAPPTAHGQRLAKRLREYGESYFEFITTPGVEPTNNLAEQAIRFVVIDRLITQGTRGEAGQRFCERIWTVIATCTQQGRSVFEYLGKAVEALMQGKEAPTLLPQEP